MKNLFNKHTDEILKEKFLNVKTLADLAEVLEVKTGHLYYWLNVQCNSEKYISFDILKRNGKKRIICAPKSSLKILQKKLNHILLLFYNAKAPVHGFAKGKNIISNANMHINKKLILNIDLQDFFTTINKGRVFGIFRKKPFGFSILMSKILSNLCCLENFMPTGSPTSPILSNYACRNLDNNLTILAKFFNCTYTRYADDITFSTNQKEFPREIAEIFFNEDKKCFEFKVGIVLEQIIKRNGFYINNDKTRIQKKHNRQIVTGLVVNKKVNVSRKYIKETKAMLYNWEVNKLKYSSILSEDDILKKAYDYHLLKNPTKKYFHFSNKKNNFKNVINGRINFIKNVRGSNDFVYAKLRNKYNKLAGIDKPNLPTNLKELIKEQIKQHLWIVESENGAKQGTAFLIKNIGFITCYHCLYDNDEIIDDVNVFQTPFRNYKIEVISKCKEIDLVLFKLLDSEFDYTKGFICGDSSLIAFGSKLTLAGFPERGCEYEPDIRSVNVTRKKRLRGIDQICLDTPVITGQSGGPLLNDSLEVVGVAATGSSYKDSDKTTNYAYIDIVMIDKLLNKHL